MKLFRSLRMFALLPALLLGTAALFAQATGTGSVRGRVQNAATGQYLENARVSVPGTSLIAFTTEDGTFTLSGVPAGTTSLRVFFTGFDERAVPVTITAGQVTQQDVKLASLSRHGAEAEAVKLDAFTVQATRETDASMIAVNEQRFAGNITSVVAKDEFGTMTDSNPGELLKFLPGVDVEYFANQITGVSVRGLGADNSELNFDGMAMTSINAERVGRGFETQYATVTDIARVEIRKLPLPQDSANAIGGTINLVRRSAFEYSKRKIDYQVVMRSDGEMLTTEKMDGPKDRLLNRWRPNWRVTWTEPLTKDFGFTFTLGQEDMISNVHWSLPGWNLGTAANNAFAEAEMAAGRPVPTNRPSIYNPAMNNPLNHNAPSWWGKDYASLRVDWRPQRELTLGASLSANRGWKQTADDVRYRWQAGATPQYNDQFRTLGQPGAGFALQERPQWRDIEAPSISSVINARWKKGAWELNGKGGWSYSKYQMRDTESGFFHAPSVRATTGLVSIPETGVGSGTANPIPLTMEFLQNYWGPQQINAWTTVTGASSTNGADYTKPVEWWNLDTNRIGGAAARPGRAMEIVTSAKLFAKRHFGSNNPLSVQLGYDWSERYRNHNYITQAWRFVGADGVPNSPDDTARLIAAESLPRRPDSEYGIPGPQRLSMSKFYALYQKNPSWFRYDAEQSELRTMTDGAAYDLTETIHAPYVELDWRLFRNRLRITGGVRYEKTLATAHGLLTDNGAAYMKYANGATVHLNDRDAAGNLLVTNLGSANVVNYVLSRGPSVLPATISGAPIFTAEIQAAGNALRAAGGTTDTATNLGRSTLLHTRTVYKRKGATNAGGNDAYYPSVHATYSVTENTLFQFGYAKTQGRLNFANALIPNTNISHDPVTSGEGAGAVGRITAQNPDLKPWTADNFEARISYYSKSGGVIGLGVFRKNVKDFQPTIDTPPMTAEDVKAAMAMFPDAGIGPEYENYSLRYRLNGGSARLDGTEFEGRQSLDRFVPNWARGFYLGGSLSYFNRKGPNGGELGANRAWTGSANLRYTRRSFSARLDYRLNGLQIVNANLSSNGKSGRQIREAQHLLDLSFDYRLTRWAKLFAQATNLTNDRRVDEDRYAERPTWSNLNTSTNLGRSYALGVTGEF